MTCHRLAHLSSGDSGVPPPLHHYTQVQFGKHASALACCLSYQIDFGSVLTASSHVGSSAGYLALLRDHEVHPIVPGQTDADDHYVVIATPTAFEQALLFEPGPMDALQVSCPRTSILSLLCKRHILL